MKKVLVTGASGFIGRHIVETFAASGQYEVVAVTSGRREVPFLRGRIEEANLLDESARGNLLARVKPDIILHYAWSLPNGKFHDAEDNIKWLEASLSLLRLFKEQGGQFFFFAGSSSEYGEGTKGNMEVGAPVEYSLYGKTKLAFEDTATLFCEKYGIRFLSGRYFSVYGPWDLRCDAALPTVIQTLLSGKSFVCKSPENLWDFVFIGDAAKATYKLVEKNECGIFNIASGRPVAMRRVFTIIANLIGEPSLMEFAENPSSVSLTADVSKLKKSIGDVCTTSIENGLYQTVQWWRTQIPTIISCGV